MNPRARLTAMLTGLVLLLTITPSWAQLLNPTVSDTNHNTAGGSNALVNVDETPTTGGLNNTAFGDAALQNNTTGDLNTANGANALKFNTTGGGNTASGANALRDNTNGVSNTAMGRAALVRNTSGTSNTACGAGALSFNTTGFNNTASGTDALRDNTVGFLNTANGIFALASNTVGVWNTASGGQALSSNTTGGGNTAAGLNALFRNTTGGGNTATGLGALLENTTGSRNTALGSGALESNTTGNKNIAVGWNAGKLLTLGNHNIYIGNQGAGSEFQTIRIGTAQTGTFIAGIATATVSNAATVIIDTTTGQLGIPLSSARYKQDIAPMGTSSEKVLDLRPVTFAYKDDSKGTTHYGLIAEQVATVYPELVTHTASGEVQTVKYQELIPMLLNELQRQHRELVELRSLVGARLGQ